jgi:hypothetical protein
MVTVAARQERPRAQTHRLVLMAAARAEEALRLTPLLKRLFALILGPIIYKKIKQIQAILKLNRVLGHPVSPAGCVCSECSPAGRFG